MRRALTWLAGLAGIAALLRRRSRQRSGVPQSLPSLAETTAVDPAVELRQRLDDARTADPAPSPDVESPLSLDERRARVHERATEAITQMQGADDDDPLS